VSDQAFSTSASYSVSSQTCVKLLCFFTHRKP